MGKSGGSLPDCLRCKHEAALQNKPSSQVIPREALQHLEKTSRHPERSEGPPLRFLMTANGNGVAFPGLGRR